ncbi:spindle apparatus coiled-coil protein 1 spindly [Anticarsia gemmatalis]|uniref:spindle apparatus coiled-coil protein 1 spindly n=1 Tax=Anticarsia gemmatalis TaxID=129554 RepID=UPI003F7774CB
MDYSTISNKTNCTEVEELTNGELSERYYILKKQYDNLSSNYEATKQELHDTRRSYQTALDVQSHLNAELESYQADEARRKTDLTSKITSLQEEISQLREERTEVSERHAAEIKKFETQIRNLKEEQAIKVRESPERDNSEIEEFKNVAKTALSDAAAAKAALDEARIEIASWRIKAEELINEIGEMRAAADLRREEMRAANEREATALAELAEAKAMLHQCTVSQDLEPHAAKGNSIFAEVEDKRQEMAKNLIQMKQTNSRLRRELANKQAELDSLLHEKQTIWEQQAGASAHYDRELIEAYEERITQLQGACEKQRRELARWFGKLGEPTANGWLPGVLEHLKSECEQLRAEVLSRGAAQLASAAQVRDLRRKLALLTANSTKQRISSPANKPELNGEQNKTDIGMPKVAIQVKNKPTPEDVKKKVSFN